MTTKPQDFLDNKGKWNCTKCGACCKNIGHLVKIGLLPKDFDRGNGTCINLAEDNTCKIYETRPSICRVDRKFWRDKDLATSCSLVANQVDDRGAKARGSEED